MRRGGFLLLGFAIVAGVLRFASSGGMSVSPEKVPVSAATQQKKDEQPPPNAPKETDHSDETSIGPTIAAFFGAPLALLNVEEHPSQAVQEQLQDLQSHWYVPDEDNRTHIEFVIASLPDPVHTHLALLFDRDIDVIQEAAQKQGCSFDRSTLPWDPDSHPESSNIKHRLEAEAISDARQKWPGLMIFRGRSQRSLSSSQLCADKHLFVFVVGEAPTGGINKIQFQNALRIIQQIRWGPLPPQHLPLYILGPSFSGSFFSLETVLKESADFYGDSPVTVYSGSVTSGCAQMRFVHEYATKTPPQIRFASFQESDERLIEGFVAFVESQNYKKGDIAIISEDETDFGYISTEPGLVDADPSAEQPSKDRDVCASPAQSAPGDKKKKDRYDMLRLHFPREISQLRAAYQSVTPPDSNSSQVLIPLDFQMTGNDDDSVSEFAKAHTPISQEGIMLELAGDLHKHHSKFILLFATDPMDQLFLAQYFRRAFPNARVGVSNPDLILLREGDALLYGTYGVSTYSLAAGAANKLFHSSLVPGVAGDASVFPSNFEQGVYNAALGLLAPVLRAPAQATIQLPIDVLPAARYVGYAATAKDTCAKLTDRDKLTPALQVTMLGRDGYWDIQALLPLANDPARPALNRLLKPQAGSPVPEDDSQHLPISTYVVLLLFALLALFHAYSTHCGNVFSSMEAIAQFAYVPCEAPSCSCEDEPAKATDKEEEPGYPREILVGIGALLLASALLLLLVPRIVLKLDSATESDRASVWLEFFMIVGVLAFGAVIAYNLGIKRKCWKWAIIFAVLFLAIVLFGFTIALSRASAFAWLWSSRSMHLTNGCSALLVLLTLIAGAYWWTLYGLRGMVLTDNRRPRLPLRKDLPEILLRSADDQKILSDLRRAAHPFTVSRFSGIAMGVFLLLFILVLGYRHSIQTLEGSWFDYPVALFLAMGVCGLAWTLAKILEVWRGGEQLLSAIDRVPLRDAFGRLQGFEWASLWAPASSTLRESYRYVGRQIESLERFIGAAEISISKSRSLIPEQPLLDQLRTAVAQRQSVLNAIREVNDETASTSKIFAEYETMQKAAAASAGQIICQVLALAWARTDRPVASETPKFLRKRAWRTPSGRLLLLAEEYVALTYTSFLATVFVRIRSLVMAAIGIYVSLLMAMSVYPFEPSPTLLTMGVALLLASGVVVGYVYVRMHKDGILSRLTATKEGELDGHFWFQLIGAGAVPVLALIAGQFPAFNQIAAGLLEPAIKALK
jgi:hypothetical protein